MLSFYWQRIVNNTKTTYLLPISAEHSLEIPLFYIWFGFESWKCRRSHWPLYRQWCCYLNNTFWNICWVHLWTIVVSIYCIYASDIHGPHTCTWCLAGYVDQCVPRFVTQVLSGAHSLFTDCDRVACNTPIFITWSLWESQMHVQSYISIYGGYGHSHSGLRVWFVSDT